MVTSRKILFYRMNALCAKRNRLVACPYHEWLTQSRLNITSIDNLINVLFYLNMIYNTRNHINKRNFRIIGILCMLHFKDIQGLLIRPVNFLWRYKYCA